MKGSRGKKIIWACRKRVWGGGRICPCAVLHPKAQ